MKTVLMVDPDEGWKYGFPKPYPINPSDVDRQAINWEEWLIAEGYPKERIEYWLRSSFGCVPIRFWEEDV